MKQYSDYFIKKEKNIGFRCLMALSIVVLLLGCSGNSAFRARLIAMDSLLVEHPDSIYRVLCGLEAEVSHQSYADRMYYELLRADAQNKAYVDFTTDSVMQEVTKYYDDNGTPNEQMRAHYLLGCTYRDLKDVPMELQCFLDATEKADTASEDCDLYTLAAVYGQMAEIYDEQHLPNEELKSLAMLEKVSAKDKDTLTSIVAYELRIRSYWHMRMYDSILSVSEAARKKYLAIGNTKYAARLLNPAISILLDRGEYEKAKQYMTIFKKESGWFNGNEIVNSSAYIHYHNLGRYAIHANKTDSALFYFRRLQEKKKYEAAYEGLLSLYEKLGNSDSMAKYSRLYASANDSSQYAHDAITIAQIKAMYDYGHQKKIALEKISEQKKTEKVNMKLCFLLIFFLLLVLLAAVFIYYKNREKNRKHQILFKRYIDLSAYIKELEAEKEGLKVIEKKNNDQTSRIESLQKELESSKQEIERLSSQFHKAKGAEETFDFEFWLTNFKANKITESLWTIVISPKAGKKSSAFLLVELHKHYKLNCPHFFQMITSPLYDLNDLDRKVVMLNICDFTTSDIANILDKTPQQISNINTRIKNKIFPSLNKTNLLKKNLLVMLRDSLSNK